MMLARVVTNVRANFCLKFIQNTRDQRREKKREKRGFGSVRVVHPKQKNSLSLRFFLFFFLSFVIKERRETNNTYERMWRRRGMMTMMASKRVIKEARMSTTTTSTNTTLAFIRSSFFEGGGKGGSKLFCAPCLTSSSSRRGFTVSSVSGENGIGSTIPVAFLEEKKIKNEVEVEESEETNDAFEGLPGYAPPGVDVMLMAVPKAKVTPSRKKRRNQFKRVEFVRDARKCPTCRKPMRSWHNFCCPPKDDEKEDVVYSTTE